MLHYGLPTSSSKLKVKQIDQQFNNGQIFIRSRYDDISACGKIIQVIQTLNEVIPLEQAIMADIDLEIALLQFLLNFRSAVLGDPKLIQIGSTARKEALEQMNKQQGSDSDEEAGFNYTGYSRIEKETVKAFDVVAMMMEAPNMNNIIEAFATKMLLNLAYSGKASGKTEQ